MRKQGREAAAFASCHCLIEHDDFHLFPSACGGEAPIRPWDWLQSTEITKQMDIEQISVNLSWERINRVKDGNLCVRVRAGVWGRAGGEWWAAGAARISSGPAFVLLLCHDGK